MGQKLPPETASGLVLLISFAALYVVNALVIGVANVLVPQHVVLGTMSLTPIKALLLSTGVLACIASFAIPIVRVIEHKRGKMFTTKDWMLFYFLLNFVGVWVVARASKELGMGVSSWVVVLVLALVLDATQGAVMMFVEKRKMGWGL